MAAAAATGQNRTQAKRTPGTMTREEFLAWAREQKQSRDNRGEAQAEKYGLVLIGSNANDPRSFGVQNLDGIIYRIGSDGRTYDYETGTVCPDQARIDPINERLAYLGADFRLSTKHRTIRTKLWLELPEVV